MTHKKYLDSNQISNFQTRKTTHWLAVKLSGDGHSVAVLSGDLTVEQRLAVLDRFRAGLEKVLITTNVLSRGKYSYDKTINSN